MTPAHTSCSARPQQAFTLIEVVLAVAIALALFVVSLHFYRQTSRLRSELASRTDQISSVRLLMDRMTSELRTARIDPFLYMSVRGESNSIEFIHTTLPRPAAWQDDVESAPAFDRSDVEIIRYALAGQGTNIAGITRAEEAVLELPPSTENLPPTTLSSNATTAGSGALLVTDQIRHLQLRYYDGREWRGTWHEVRPPIAVEITLAADPPEPQNPAPKSADPQNADPQAALFRRTVFLPGHMQPVPESSSLQLLDTATNDFPALEESEGTP